MLIPLRLCAIALLFTLGSLQAATLPYFENFDDDTVGSATPSEPAPESGTFSASSVAFAVVSAGISGQSYNVTGSTDNTTHGAAVDFTGALGGAAASATSFTISSQFRFNTGTAGPASAGLGLLGTGNTFTSGYFADITSDSGLIRIVESNSGTATVVASLDAGTLTLGEVYTLTLTGTYTDSDANLVNDTLQLSATVSGTGLGGSINYTDSTPQTGTFFGYRNRNNASNINVDMDAFSVIPEPGSVALLAFSTFAIGVFRRVRPARA